jgi:hypothetical protein
MIVNIKKASKELSSKEASLVKAAFERGRPYQSKSFGEFFAFVETVGDEFERLAKENNKIKKYLHLWKGDSKKFYLEIIPFKHFLEKVNLTESWKVRIADDTVSYDVMLSNGKDRKIFEIVSAYIDKQDIYRTHHLNENGWVACQQTYHIEPNGDLIPDIELAAIKTTPGKETEILTNVIARIKSAVCKKQKKGYKDTSLIVVTGINAVFDQNQYAIERVKETLALVDDGTFSNIYVLDYGLQDLIWHRDPGVLSERTKS